MAETVRCAEGVMGGRGQNPGRGSSVHSCPYATEAGSLPWMGQRVSDIHFSLPWCCHPASLFFSPLISFPNSLELMSVIVTHLSRNSWCPRRARDVRPPILPGSVDSCRSPFFPAASISLYWTSPTLTICPGIFCL